MKTYYVINDDMESILNVFTLKTQYSETVIGGFIQNPLVTMEDFGGQVDAQRDGGQIVEFEVSKYDPVIDLFSNVPEMSRIIKWIRKL